MGSIFPFRARRDEVEAEAAAWIVQLDGRTPSKEDLAELALWARRSPRHAAALTDLARIWGEIDGVAELAAAVAAEQAAAPARSSRRRSALPVGLAAAAALVLAAAAGLAAGVQLLDRKSAPVSRLYATQVGEQRTVELADGSTVRINTNSLVEVTYAADARRVRLVRGEALFDVEKDPERPFTVFADGSAVRAVGTVFSVRLEEHRVDVAVSEGAVQLIAEAAAPGPEAASYRVEQLQIATLAEGSATISTLEAGDLEKLLAWREGVLVFEGRPLSEVVEEFNRYTATPIAIVDPALLDVTVGGRFGVGETDALLEVLEAGFGVRVIRTPEAIELSRASPL